ncbi:sensor histidine kinase [Massilia sp. S19_KUP03_FR1]|uniref:sensor histidine kinase n=1 Tax=Massilia sp. S19_KUP03_FR1 TaxID=3025503 RepID=UPI002FCDB273
MDDTPHAHDLFVFLASTAHDMKNSISVVSGTLERLLGDAAPGSPLRDSAAYPEMAQMLYQTRRLNDNLMQLLALYKDVGTPAYPLDIAFTDVAQLAEQVAANNRVLLEARDITLEIDAPPGLCWHLDEDLVIGVVNHAINNATRYTRDRIRLSMMGGDGMLEIRVEDNGAGFPPALLAAGAVAGRTRAVDFGANSAGLGLYFATEVAKMHAHRGTPGTVRLENGGRLSGGCFVLRLP